MSFKTYFKKHKDDAFQKFKLFMNMVENEIGWKIKVFWIDRGGEYLSIKFNNIVSNKGLNVNLHKHTHLK